MGLNKGVLWNKGFDSERIIKIENVIVKYIKNNMKI